MSEHKVWMILGGIIMVIGFILLSAHTTFYTGGEYYGSIYMGGSIVWSKTLGLMAAKLAVLGAGYLVYRRGENLRDSR